MPSTIKQRQIPIALLAFFCLAFGAAYRYSLSATDSGHLARSECDSCHMSRDLQNPDKARLLLASQQQLCGGCHRQALHNSHPINFQPTRALPNAFPLDWKQEMTCSSCHKVHGHQPGLPRVAQRGRAYCEHCHETQFFEALPDRGMSLTMSGHLSLDNLPADAAIDGTSLHCLSCHDKLDGVLRVNIAQRHVLRHEHTSNSHPIGTLYTEAQRRGGYHPRARLDAVIDLPDGKLACTSCHQGYTREHGALVMSNAGSQLCFQCHNL